jgi:hypothetical protein
LRSTLIRADPDERVDRRSPDYMETFTKPSAPPGILEALNMKRMKL